jgi:flagellin FlaA/flagellin FlaB
MVLVAAIAAGVLINTAGFLQSKSQQTGEQSSKQVSNRLQEVTTTGSDIDGDAGTLGEVNATVTWIGPQGTYTLTNSSIDSADGDFTVATVKDADDSAPVLNDPDDRLDMGFDVDTFAAADLEEGDTVTIKVNTMSGATTEIRFTVPEALTGKTAVEL